MKLFLIALTMIATQTFAGEVYICREIGGDEFSPRKMLLTQVGEDEVEEGRIFPFKLQVFQDREVLVDTTVNVRTEDVMFRFTNTSKKIAGMIYLDEMDQTWLKIGSKSIKFDCR